MDRHLDHEFVGHELGRESTGPVDFAFLRTQTFADVDLARELLQLFRAQAKRLVPGLPAVPPRVQADTAHLLKGSAHGIGAWAAAEAAARYESAPAEQRHLAYPALAAAFDLVDAAITTYLGAEPR